MVEKVISPSMTFDNWTFIEWLKGNWGTIKELVKVGAPLILGLSIVKDNPALVTTITVAGKLVLDTIQYYFKNVKK